MDPELARISDRRTTKLNPDIANGLATKHMQPHEVENYINAHIRSLARDFPDGVTYHGLERCTPEEEFAEQTRKRSESASRRTFDVSHSDLYMVKANFRQHGAPLEPLKFYLPYVSDGGTITISDGRFVISPVLADRVFSIGIDDIFMLLTRARLTFERMDHHIRVNNKRITEPVVWSQVHNISAAMKKMKKAVRAKTTLMHYLLCKYGFSAAFERFAHCNPVVGEAEINEQSYPPDEWVIVQTNGLQPAGCKRTYWVPTTIRVAIRKSEWSDKAKCMLAGFYYIVDHFPLHMKPEWVNSSRQWMIIMGNILFSPSIGVGRLVADIESHLESLDEYVDTLLQAKLRDIGMPLTDTYELFSVIIEKYNQWLLGAADSVSSMWGKEISILYYVLYNITSSIVNMYFRLKAATKKEVGAITRKELTPQEVTKIMKDTVKPGMIFSLTRKHGEVSTISCPGDNKAFKLTTILVQQTDTDRSASKGDRVSVDDPVNWAHASIMEVGGYGNLPKSDPTGRGRINQFLQLSEKGVVQRRPDLIEILDSVQQQIKR